MSAPERSAVLLVSHGSRDPRAGYVAAQLVSAVAARTGRLVWAAHLDFTEPTPDVALRSLAAEGVTAVRIVPLLFTPGYHVTTDVPAAVDASGVSDRVDVSVAPALLQTAAARGLLRGALLERLDQALTEKTPFGQPAKSAPRDLDGIVLASAGSSSSEARSAVEVLAGELAVATRCPVVPAYASASQPDVAAALEGMRSRGLTRLAVASLFVAPGRLPDSVARDAGDTAVADPLGVASALVRLLVDHSKRRLDPAHAAADVGVSGSPR